MATHAHIRKKISKTNTTQNEEAVKEVTEFQFPTKNGDGYELFDANDNRLITLEERTEMLEKAEEKFSELMDIFRISRNDPNCEKTPRRLSKMFINELLAGRYAPPPKSTIFPNRKKVDELIISKGIEVMSVCSHHWQPISGTCAWIHTRKICNWYFQA